MKTNELVNLLNGVVDPHMLPWMARNYGLHYLKELVAEVASTWSHEAQERLLAVAIAAEEERKKVLEEYK